MLLSSVSVVVLLVACAILLLLLFHRAVARVLGSFSLPLPMFFSFFLRCRYHRYHHMHHPIRRGANGLTVQPRRQTDLRRIGLRLVIQEWACWSDFPVFSL